MLHNLLVWGGGGEVMCANSLGVNAPTVADYKLST